MSVALKTFKGWVILNHYSELWTPKVFSRQGEAMKYLKTSADQNPKWHIDNHEIVPATISVTIAQ